MKRMDVLKSLATDNGRKMILLVMDGLGGLPGPEGKTELEAALKPNMDALAQESELGLLDMVDVGITPGSGPGHLSLFGYDPLEYSIGRGILEAMGVGALVGPGDICARGNFCTRDGDIITDRRAGRIATEKSALVVQKLAASIKEVEGARVAFYPGKEHRFVVVFSGEGLSEDVSDADPQLEGVPMRPARPTAPGGERMARVANAFIDRVGLVLQAESPANACLLRGFSSAPDIPLMPDLYRIKPVAVATYPMYKGLAKLVGMSVADAGETLEHLFETVGRIYDEYDYFYVHVKYTDSRGEDGDFEGKKKVVETVDALLPRLLRLSPDVLVITGDHSTPSLMSGHSWHPVPFLLKSDYARRGDSASFGESQCRVGAGGRIDGRKLIGLMLAHARRLEKFGA
ncbi:MAG: cofactor-independent phosphoglycerate mutase [Synergistetes bacterium ADurb.BinA166]|nr:MAG: cofactor-independent phosphoglycerate mutase [Synergistetes bacterium ADurb.BinA166]